MGKLLDDAKKNRSKQNQKVAERLEELREDAEDFEAEAETFLELLTTFDDAEKVPTTTEILVRKKIPITVYDDLNGEQQELMAQINSVHRESKRRGKNNSPDLEKAIDAACKLCASLVVPEDGKPWHRETTWRGMLKLTDFEGLMEILSELLEPYQERCRKLGKFR